MWILVGYKYKPTSTIPHPNYVGWIYSIQFKIVMSRKRIAFSIFMFFFCVPSTSKWDIFKQFMIQRLTLKWQTLSWVVWIKGQAFTRRRLQLRRWRGHNLLWERGSPRSHSESLSSSRSPTPLSKKIPFGSSPSPIWSRHSSLKESLSQVQVPLL